METLLRPAATEAVAAVRGAAAAVEGISPVLADYCAAGSAARVAGALFLLAVLRAPSLAHVRCCNHRPPAREQTTMEGAAVAVVPLAGVVGVARLAAVVAVHVPAQLALHAGFVYRGVRGVPGGAAAECSHFEAPGRLPVAAPADAVSAAAGAHAHAAAATGDDSPGVVA